MRSRQFLLSFKCCTAVVFHLEQQPKIGVPPVFCFNNLLDQALWSYKLAETVINSNRSNKKDSVNKHS